MTAAIGRPAVTYCGRSTTAPAAPMPFLPDRRRPDRRPPRRPYRRAAAPAVTQRFDDALQHGQHGHHDDCAACEEEHVERHAVLVGWEQQALAGGEGEQAEEVHPERGERSLSSGHAPQSGRSLRPCVHRRTSSARWRSARPSRCARSRSGRRGSSTSCRPTTRRWSPRSPTSRRPSTCCWPTSRTPSRRRRRTTPAPASSRSARRGTTPTRSSGPASTPSTRRGCSTTSPPRSPRSATSST